MLNCLLMIWLRCDQGKSLFSPTPLNFRSHNTLLRMYIPNSYGQHGYLSRSIKHKCKSFSFVGNHNNEMLSLIKNIPLAFKWKTLQQSDDFSIGNLYFRIGNISSRSLFFNGFSINLQQRSNNRGLISFAIDSNWISKRQRLIIEGSSI